jgi:hypothetical protein
MNRFLTACAISTISLSFFSQHAFANRPAIEEKSQSANIAEEAVAAPASPTVPEEVVTTQYSGDVVSLPAREIQPGETITVNLLDSPRRGASMDKVKDQLGQPVSVSDSVGEPPITRWIYNDRVVYFEHSTVLHVVSR